jgi:hypothetical protein
MRLFWKFPKLAHALTSDHLRCLVFGAKQNLKNFGTAFGTWYYLRKKQFLKLS